MPAALDDGTQRAKQRCKAKRRSERRSCVQDYLDRKRLASGGDAQAEAARASAISCPAPSDAATAQENAKLAQCLHSKERPNNDFLREHLVQPPASAFPPPPACAAARPKLAPAALRRCIKTAGHANWTATGLVDGSPECGRSWLRTACVRGMFEGVDALFIGNSVIRRQMFTVLDVLAGPAARRLLRNGTEAVPKLTVHDSYRLSDPLLMYQQGIIAKQARLEPLLGGGWSADRLQGSRMWDRDSEPDAYHAAQVKRGCTHTHTHTHTQPYVLLAACCLATAAAWLAYLCRCQFATCHRSP